MTNTRSIPKIMLVLALAGTGLFLAAPSSPAAPVAPVAPVQVPCDPDVYSCPPETPLEFQLDLTLSIVVGPQGLAVDAQVCGFSGPGIPFQVAFASIQIISGVSGPGETPATTCSETQTFSNESSPTGGALASQLAAGGVLLVSAAQQNAFPLDFKVPSLPALNDYPVCATAPGHNSDCEQFRIIGDSGTSNDSLVRTGISIGVLLALALALIIGGRTLVESSRRRRRGTDEDLDAGDPPAFA
jgi:hypothetical protein